MHSEREEKEEDQEASTLVFHIQITKVTYASLQTDGRTPGGLKVRRNELLLDSHACRWSNLKSKEAASRISQLRRNSSTCSWRKTSDESNQYGAYTELESMLT